MAKNTKAFVQDFAFYEQLWEYYSKNRGKDVYKRQVMEIPNIRLTF